MQSLIAAIHSLRLSVVGAQIAQTLFHNIHMSLVVALLIIDNRLFQALCEIDTVNGVEARKQICLAKHTYKIVALTVKQLAEVEKKTVAGDIV